MAFRVVTIEHPAEVHARSGQLQVIQDQGTASIPLEDIAMLIADAPNIRLSIMCLCELSAHHITVVTMGRNHLPCTLTIPMVTNARQSRVTARQAAMPEAFKALLWKQVVVSKIENQARALAILGLDGAEEVWSFSLGVCPGDPDDREGAAARCYFQHLQPGLNRRRRDPLNSALNYGYAIVRAAVARSLVVAGFVPALGIHHHSQLNAFNLADDIMEPLRPVVDILALEVVESSCELSRQQRSKLRGVLLRTVCLENQEMTVLRATDRMGESLRGATTCEDASLMLTPTILAQGTETQCA